MDEFSFLWINADGFEMKIADEEFTFVGWHYRPSLKSRNLTLLVCDMWHASVLQCVPHVHHDYLLRNVQNKNTTCKACETAAFLFLLNMQICDILVAVHVEVAWALQYLFLAPSFRYHLQGHKWANFLNKNSLFLHALQALHLGFPFEQKALFSSLWSKDVKRSNVKSCGVNCTFLSNFLIRPSQ